ncbi:MAG: hypothetical protein HON23_06240, partial [Rickettsiales bacterium]|nr:hypothetical protein [Rickettsiales bacterium]
MPVVTEDLIIKNFNLYLEELAVKRGGFKIGEAPEVGASTNASEFAGALATELNKDWPFFTNITPRTTVLCEENVKEGEYAEKFLTKECLDNLKDNLKGNKEAFRKFIDYSRQKEYEKVLEAAQKAEKVTQNNDIEACFTKYSASYNFREALAELDKSLGTSSDSFAEAKEAMKQESKGFSGAISTVASNETPDLPQLHLSKLLEIGTKIGYISEYAHIKSQVDKVQVLIDFFFDKRNLSQQGAEAQETISHDDFCRDIEAIREAEETAEKLASLIDIFRDGQSEPCSIDEDKNVTFDLSRVEVNIDSALAEEGAFNLGESEPFVINLDDLKLAAAAAAAEKKVIKALIAGCKALENECLEDGVGYDRVTDIRGKVAKFAEKIGDEYKEELESYMEKIDEKEQSFFIAGDVELAKLILSAQKAESEEIIRQLLEAKVSKLETAAQALEEAQRLALESASAAEQAQTAQLAQHTAALTAERKRSESDIASLTTKYDKSVKELGQKLKEGEEAAEQAAAAATAALETQHAAALEDAEEAARGQEVELSAQKQVTKKAAAAVMKTALTGISQSRVRQGFGAWKQETKALQEAERSVVQEKAHAAELSAQAAAQAVQAELQGKLSASAAALEALRVEHAAAQEQNARIVEELSALNTRVVANIDSELVTLRDQKGALEAELAAEQAASTQATAAAAAHAAALEAQAASQVAEFGAEQARATAAAQAQVVAAREELETLRAAHEAALAEQAAQQAAAAAQTQQAEETARLAVEQAASTQAAEAAEQAAAAATAALEAARVAKEQATAALETQVAELEGIKADHALAIGVLRSALDGNQRELSQEKIKALEMETSLELLRGKDTEGLLDEKHADQQALITELQLRLKKQEDHAREYIPSLSKMVGEVSEERDGVIRELETSQAGFRSLTQENDNLKLAIEGKDRVMAGLESHTDRDDDLQRKEEEAKEERESLIRDLEYSVTKAEEENADLHRQIGAKDVEILHLQTQSGSSTHSLAAGDGDSAGGSKGRKAVGSSDGSRALDGLAETTVDVSDDSSLEEGDPGQSRGGSSGSHSLDSTAKLTDELTTLRAQVDQMNVANADRRLETERHRIAAGREVALSKHESEVKIAETQAKAQIDVEALRSQAEARMLAARLVSEEKLSADRLLIEQAELRAQQLRVQQARVGRFQERKLEQMKAQSSERARMLEVEQQREQIVAEIAAGADSQKHAEDHQLAMQKNAADEYARQDAARAAEQVRQDAAQKEDRDHKTALQAAEFA